MADLYTGLAIIWTLGIGCFAASVAISRKVTRPVCDALAFMIVVAIFVYTQCVWYNPRLVSLLPFSNLVVVGNWYPLAAGALGGLAWQRIPGRMFRKSLFIGGLTAASSYSAVFPLLGTAPECDSCWWKKICLQTKPQTCTPACAATLLGAHGIRTTENEMARLCLTRDGTTWMGLYRGLKLKTKNTPWDVEVVTCDADQLLAMNNELMILSVGLAPFESQEERSKMKEWGWEPGIGHSVILMGPNNGRFMIADPTPGIGQEDWTRDDVRQLFRGTAVRLIKRS